MKVIQVLRSHDNTGKIAIELDDGTVIESVLLVDQNSRVTACLSSQVGCPQGCQFCKTATLGFIRNLETKEIVGQFDFLSQTFSKEITNIVYMGMGEPLLNTKAVLESITIFTNPKRYNIFLRRITISTSGYLKGIPELTKKAPYPGLAFSLITGRQELRSKLMPGTPDLKTIKDALLEYQSISRKRIILEIICFKGINETLEEAIQIKNFADGLNVIINIIPFNSIDDSRFQEPEIESVKEFTTHISNLGLMVTIRHGKGQDILGACGQLGGLNKTR